MENEKRKRTCCILANIRKSAEENKKRRNRKWIAMLLIFLLSFSGFVVCYYGLENKSDERIEMDQKYFKLRGCDKTQSDKKVDNVAELIKTMPEEKEEEKEQSLVNTPNETKQVTSKDSTNSALLENKSKPIGSQVLDEDLCLECSTSQTLHGENVHQEEQNIEHRTDLRGTKGKLRYLDRYFTFENFMADPVGSIKKLEHNNIFKMVSIPKILLIFIRRRLKTAENPVKNFFENYRYCNKRLSAYSKESIKRSFFEWVQTMKHKIENKEDRIECESKSFFDVALKTILKDYCKDLLMKIFVNNKKEKHKEQQKEVEKQIEVGTIERSRTTLK
ncbi:uncharacterized protein VICG_01208 [Vittaforma corneae ATCC 50505]|uniref:Plasmodium RESA N-terminal domain-containing protein n=1 Tax=Vittaforma corneae (strain ATCC 50505) TaxID=993615 RepID=L2GM52_VITCO|nr:uncharacterized protein VICG_01208 [Vittaforma corneae ATCC 50505]ELA41704.1 hypothetical protein VICG_01208 [Vittaforma corneae ATCC 50505]